ncbi:MAG: methyl-accepting chemotaxis protein [Tissierellaceae bacterium]
MTPVTITIGIGVGIAIILLLILLSRKGKSNNEAREIIRYISQIDSLDFSIEEDANITREIREKLNSINKQIVEKLKAQVGISTDVFFVSEKLNILASDSLNTSETIAASVETADENIANQSKMLRDTQGLTNKIYQSMERIGGEVIDKIQFISSSIEAAQGGIESIADIESMIKGSKDILRDISAKTAELRDYSQEVVKLMDLINNISNQTKMLSLNASIEAARAGEQGKGFGVVAVEVGKLAAETEDVSKKIEEVIGNLTNEIVFISETMGKEMVDMDNNYEIIEKANREFISIVDSLNLGRESLETIKDSTAENGFMIKDIIDNIGKITEFSEETTAQMEETTSRVMDQHTMAKNLHKSTESIREHVDNMQQSIVGSVMEEKMLKQTYEVREYFQNKGNVTDSMIGDLLKTVGVDAIYITDSSGIVQYTNEKSAIGLDLYMADPSFRAFKEGNVDYLVTPIKQRVEDGKLFKFLTVSDESGKLYEVGLGLESLFRNI